MENGDSRPRFCLKSSRETGEWPYLHSARAPTNFLQCAEAGKKHASGAKQAAEKGLILTETCKNHTAGAEALIHFGALAARLKSCADTSCPFVEFFRSL